MTEGKGWSRSLLSLRFQDPEYEGLEIVMRRPSIGDTVRTSTWYVDSIGEDITPAEMIKIQSRMHEQRAEIIASKIVRWNVEDPITGEPVPTTVDGLMTLDLPFLALISRTWQEQAIAVSPPLPDSSNSSELSELELSMPMDILSQSPTN